MVIELDHEGRTALTQIQKVLELEARKDYQDRSASNGVANFAGERIARVLPVADAEGQRVLREIDSLLSDYGKMSPANRQRCADESLRLLTGLISTARFGARVQESRAPQPPPPPCPSFSRLKNNSSP